MVEWVVLLRGVNVGGHNRLPMAVLCEVLTGIGARRVATYIQSGNAVFEADEADADVLAAAVTAGIEAALGFAPPAFLLTRAEFAAAVAANPFPQALTAPKSLHLMFRDRVVFDTAPLEALRAPDEEFAAIGKVFYFHAPSGFGRSKLAERLPRLLPGQVTARNLRSCLALLDLGAVRADPQAGA